MVIRFAAPLASLFLTLAACSSSSNSATSTNTAACKGVTGLFPALTLTAISGDCGTVYPQTWLLTGDDTSKGVIPDGATTDTATADASACTSTFVWHRTPKQGCAATSESAVIDLNFDAKGLTGTVDFQGCAFEGLGISVPAGCSARYTIEGQPE